MGLCPAPWCLSGDIPGNGMFREPLGSRHCRKWVVTLGSSKGPTAEMIPISDHLGPRPTTRSVPIAHQDIFVVLGPTELLNDGTRVTHHVPHHLSLWRVAQLPNLHLGLILW